MDGRQLVAVLASIHPRSRRPSSMIGGAGCDGTRPTRSATGMVFATIPIRNVFVAGCAPAANENARTASAGPIAWRRRFIRSPRRPTPTPRCVGASVKDSLDDRAATAVAVGPMAAVRLQAQRMPSSSPRRSRPIRKGDAATGRRAHPGGFVVQLVLPLCVHAPDAAPPPFIQIPRARDLRRRPITKRASSRIAKFRRAARG